MRGSEQLEQLSCIFWLVAAVAGDDCIAMNSFIESTHTYSVTRSSYVTSVSVTYSSEMCALGVRAHTQTQPQPQPQTKTQTQTLSARVLSVTPIDACTL